MNTRAKIREIFTLYFHSSNLHPNSICILNSNHIKRPTAAVSLQPEQWSTNHRLTSLTALMSCNNGSTEGLSRSAAALSLYYWLMARLYKVIGNEHWTNFTYSLEVLTLHVSKDFQSVLDWPTNVLQVAINEITLFNTTYYRLLGTKD